MVPAMGRGTILNENASTMLSLTYIEVNHWITATDTVVTIHELLTVVQGGLHEVNSYHANKLN